MIVLNPIAITEISVQLNNHKKEKEKRMTTDFVVIVLCDLYELVSKSIFSNIVDGKSENFIFSKSLEELSRKYGKSKRTVQRALNFLDDNGFIFKKNRRLSGGGKQLLININQKIMTIIEKVKSTFCCNFNYKKTDINACASLKGQLVTLQSDKLSPSYIIKNNYKNNIVKKEVTSVIFEKEFSENKRIENERLNVEIAKLFELKIPKEPLPLEVEENEVLTDKSKQTIKKHFEANKIIPNEDYNFYNCAESLEFRFKEVSDALNSSQEDCLKASSQMLKLDINNELTSQKPIQIKSKNTRSIRKNVDQHRYGELTIIQNIILTNMLQELLDKGDKFNINEIFSWAEFQMNNHEHHFQKKTFTNVLHIIRKMIIKNTYNRPIGLEKHNYFDSENE